MFGYFDTSSSATIIGCYGITEALGKLVRVSRYIYMEELDVNISSHETKQMKCVSTTDQAKPSSNLAHNKQVSIKKNDEKLVLQDEIDREDQTGGGWNIIRVGVLMTKEQAVRLLSKCRSSTGGSSSERDGEFYKDVASCELIEIPNSRRVALISSSSDDDHELETFWAERLKFD